jgi:hypothetical protein
VVFVIGQLSETNGETSPRYRAAVRTELNKEAKASDDIIEADFTDHYLNLHIKVAII